MKVQYVVVLSVFAGAFGGAGIVERLHAQARPPAYIVAEIDLNNPDGYASEFASQAQKLLTDGGGKYLARGGKTMTFDGDPPKPRVSIIAFENMDKAQAVYNSPAYRDLRKIGEKYAKFRVFAVEGAGQ
jgi:uncharacterized protein (DUF1330 family)